MKLSDAIHKRRSVRKFLDKPVEPAKLKKILDAGVQAPSACNVQGWHFIVVNDKKVASKIVREGAASFIKDAPLGILVLYDNRTDNTIYYDYVQSAAACIENMILTAYSLGISCCWICHLPTREQLKKLLNIPAHYDPIAYVVMGYPGMKASDKPRKKKSADFVSYNKYDKKQVREPAVTPALHLKRVGRKIYYKMPGRRFVKPIVDIFFEKKFD